MFNRQWLSQARGADKPDLIIADEPTTALDVTIQAQILSEVQTLVRTQGTSLIWITLEMVSSAASTPSLACSETRRTR